MSVACLYAFGTFLACNEAATLPDTFFQIWALFAIADAMWIRLIWRWK